MGSEIDVVSGWSESGGSMAVGGGGVGDSSLASRIGDGSL